MAPNDIKKLNKLKEIHQSLLKEQDKIRNMGKNSYLIGLEVSNIERIFSNIEKVGMKPSIETEINEIFIKQLPKEYYYPSGTFEYYDKDLDAYYNSNGRRLRDPSEYDTSSEGYTPFGDE